MAMLKTVDTPDWKADVWQVLYKLTLSSIVTTMFKTGDTPGWKVDALQVLCKLIKVVTYVTVHQ